MTPEEIYPVRASLQLPDGGSETWTAAARPSPAPRPEAFVEPATRETEDRPAVTSNEIRAAVADLNKALPMTKKFLQFRYHDESERMMVQVVDLETQEVIKELPPERLLDAVARARKFIGMLLDETV